ncbi:hypothetical protein GWI33_013036 [Rhynchophorus ferrugineus]|uniref:Vesicle-trafficking protein SEC22b-B n=1 Tax=Rhynchophorus ferrugineus TaxID=354439 RepID=A0A834I796_RHYFE|nr:hypothetical protein GWI33_013036 [Rhynchophorus ferrugineus]
MALMTMIARVADGLPLAATMQEDEQAGRNIMDYQNQAKMLFRKLGPQSPPRCTIETGPYLFHYLIEYDVCYLVLCEKNFSKRLAYSYLEDIAQQFHSEYGRKKAKKQFADSRSRRNLNVINNQLQDVQRIMVQNIDDVLQRGTVLSELDMKTQNLSMLTQKYKKDATYLNTKSMYVKAAVGGIVMFVIFLYFWVL